MVFKIISKIRSLLNNKIDKNVDSIDILLSLTLDLIIYEIRLDNKISNSVAEAISQITSFFSIEYYYHQGFTDLDRELKELAFALKEYNESFKNHELDVIGIKNEDWEVFFNSTIKNLLLKKPLFIDNHDSA